MDFALSADQRELTEAAADFARRELNQDLAKCDDAGEYPRASARASRDGKRPRMGESRVERLLRSVEGVAYWAAVAPALACLPPLPRLPHRLLAWRLGFPVPARETHRAHPQPARAAR